MSRFSLPGLTKPVAASLAALLCGGCAVSLIAYEVDRYGNVASSQLHLGCHDTYEVFDRPDAGSFLVATNALNESLAGICGDGTTLLPKEERMRRIAHIFLDETTDRPLCRITRETVLTGFQTEFNYRCPPPKPGAPAKPAPVAKPVLPRR